MKAWECPEITKIADECDWNLQFFQKLLLLFIILILNDWIQLVIPKIFINTSEVWTFYQKKKPFQRNKYLFDHGNQSQAVFSMALFKLYWKLCCALPLRKGCWLWLCLWNFDTGFNFTRYSFNTGFILVVN